MIEYKNMIIISKHEINEHKINDYKNIVMIEHEDIRYKIIQKKEKEKEET